MKRIYLDHSAATPVDKEVLKAMNPYFKKDYGNASSIHYFGRTAGTAVEQARKIIAGKLNAETDEIIFTSGGTESNNLAVKGIAFEKKKGHIITSKIEHDCVLNACKWLETQGFEVTYLDVDKEGIVNIEQLKKSIKNSTILVSIMHANNETGVIQPIEEIGKICREREVLFHTDACQSFTKENIDVKKMNLDLVTINSHKIYGPKGAGALFIRRGVTLTPLLHGGGQEKKLRSGTINVSGIVGFRKAVEINHKLDYIKKLRDYLINRIEKEIPNVRLNGHRTKRLCNNVNFSFKFVEGESILMMLDKEKISVSTGSACSSDSLEPSHVLVSMGVPIALAHGSIRFSLGKDNTKEEIDYTIDKLKIIIKKLRDLSPLKEEDYAVHR